MSEQIKNIAVIEKAITILEYLVAYPNGVSLSNISSDVNINKSTVHRILQTLKQYNYVAQEQTTGYYRIGPRLFIFSSFLSRFDFASFMLPYMQEFSNITGLSTNLTLLENHHSITVETYIPATNSSIKIAAKKGYKAPLYCCASGKVFLSGFSDKELDNYLSITELKPVTSHTITNVEELKNNIIEVQNTGYSIERMENEENIISLSVPIINAHGKIQAALATMTLAQTVSEEKIQELGDHLKRIAELASKSLGVKANCNKNQRSK